MTRKQKPKELAIKNEQIVDFFYSKILKKIIETI